jgi:hypothetical protein
MCRRAFRLCRLPQQIEQGWRDTMRLGCVERFTAKNVPVASFAEDAAKLPQRISELRRGMRLEMRFKQHQGGSCAADGDAHLMHTFNVA